MCAAQSIAAPAAKVSVSKFECASPASVIPVPLMLSVSASSASVQRPESSACEVEPIVSRAEVDGDAGRRAPRREGYSICACIGPDVAAAHGAHNGDTIRRYGTAA